MDVSKLIRESRTPKVGIFWIYDKNDRKYIVSFQDDVREVIEVAGFKDSEYNHYKNWREANKVIKSSGDYTETPRGRVLFNVKRGKFIVYVSDKMSKDKTSLSLIMRDFSLPMANTVISADEHYNLEANFDDDYDDDDDFV
jgi:hypothetical protein